MPSPVSSLNASLRIHLYLRGVPGVSAALPFWTPIRFPGQYHDDETDLNQNWNRFYDPWIGRYLGPDPRVASPAPSLIAIGMSSLWPTYSYASNDPISFID